MTDIKITVLPQQTDALVDDNIFAVVDTSTTTTKKTTLSKVLHGKAALSGSTFTGPLTGSVGVSGSHGDFNTYVGSGVGSSLPTEGFFRARTTAATLGNVILGARYNSTTDYPLISFDTGAGMIFGADQIGNGAHPTGFSFWGSAGSNF